VTNPSEKLTTSVVVVSKDRPDTLANLLESLTRQSLPPDEVLVVDNNSTLDYAPVLRRFEHRLPLRAVVEKTPGIPAARNRGIQEAAGELILFTDDDCQADPHWVQNMVRPFHQNPHIGVVGGEILSEEKAGTAIEQFCVDESLMRLGREGATA
jgi:GT2 family glycosyltransferase